MLAIDTNDSGGYGYGHVIASTQELISINDADGIYTEHGNSGQVGTTTVTGTSFTSQQVDYRNVKINTSGTAQYNIPWAGLVTTSSDGTGMLAGSGVYAYRDNNIHSNYYAVGLRH